MSEVDFGDPAVIAALATALEAAGVDGIEIDQDARKVRIVVERGVFRTVVGIEAPQLSPTTIRSSTVTAPIAGIFAGRHPASIGAPFELPREALFGDTLGFIRVGPVLLPVKAPETGILTRAFAGDDSLVGYGDPLFEIKPSAMTQSIDSTSGTLAKHPRSTHVLQRTLHISTIGARAFLLDAPGDFDLPAQRRIWALVHTLRQWDDLSEVVPGMTNLLAIFKTTPEDPDGVMARLRAAWERAESIDIKGKTIEIGVHYGGEHAIDLAALCDHSGLSDRAVVRLHHEGIYTVFALGSAPGFGYLHGLDPRIHMPRKTVPSLKMAKRLRHHRRHADWRRGADRSERLEFHRFRRFQDVRPDSGRARDHGAGRHRALPAGKDRAVIEIVDAGPLNTIQDLGRPGYRDIGVTASGAMDPLALKIANLLVGNNEGAAAIEVQTFPLRLRFSEATLFAVTGGANAKLDGVTLPPWWMQTAASGQVLELLPSSVDARAYIGFGGGVDVPMVMGSRSTALRGAFGGIDGRYLQKGDTLPLGEAVATALPTDGLGVVPPTIALATSFPVAPDGTLLIRALPAGEHDLFGADAERFWNQSWKISPQSDRTGYRLSGEPVRPTEPVEMRSYGIVPGVVQVPPGGKPIVQMSDANTAGGYPKIAGVLDADLWRLGQARIGSCLRFVRSSHAEARALDKVIAAYVDDVRNTSQMVGRALKTMAGR